MACTNHITDAGTDELSDRSCGDEGGLCDRCAEVDYQQHTWMAGAVASHGTPDRDEWNDAYSDRPNKLDSFDRLYGGEA